VALKSVLRRLVLIGGCVAVAVLLRRCGVILVLLAVKKLNKVMNYQLGMGFVETIH
jgi:hypothetical protein